jgi:hypothetical protein
MTIKQKDKIIEKVSGKKVYFNPSKLCSSIVLAGANKKQAEKICEMVDAKIKPGMTTSSVFRNTLRALVKEDLDIAVRYSIKRGVDALGPDGFLFEKFIEALLRLDGYHTQKNQMMSGRCVEHEIDVLAWKDRNYYIIEAKFRNDSSGTTHINQVMYADARMKDIASNKINNKDGSRHFHTWVITNATFTEHAQKFARCAGVRLTGWNYPNKDSLQSIIVRTKAYPVTVLPSLSRDAREKLTKYGLVLAQDILPYTKETLIRDFGIAPQTAAKIQKEVAQLLK